MIDFDVSLIEHIFRENVTAQVYFVCIISTSIDNLLECE
jgi:hypothetical protein